MEDYHSSFADRRSITRGHRLLLFCSVVDFYNLRFAGGPKPVDTGDCRGDLTKGETLCFLLGEDVDIGEEIPLENFQLVVIEKDAAAYADSGSNGSSCSTSSSDSSSSSDSDSESSSASGSDAESVQSPFVELKEAQRT